MKKNNNKLLTKAIIFITSGIFSFIPLIFLDDIVLAVFGINRGNFTDVNNIHNAIDTLGKKADSVILVRNLSKAFFIILGVILLAIGIYQLIMYFTEESENNN